MRYLSGIFKKLFIKTKVTNFVFLRVFSCRCVFKTVMALVSEGRLRKAAFVKFRHITFNKKSDGSHDSHTRKVIHLSAVLPIGFRS